MRWDRVRHIWIPVTALLLPGCMVPNKSLPQPEPQFLQLINLLAEVKGFHEAVPELLFEG